MLAVQNIIFDLGGVLLNIDFKRTFDAFEIIGFRGAAERFMQPDIQQLLGDVETGDLCPAEMRAKFRELTGFKCTQEQFDKAWNALLLDYWPERIELVQQLSKRYRTFLLSNTCKIHCESYNNKLDREFGIPSLDHLMEKAYYSHEMGLRKPNQRIYERVLKKSRLDPYETVFVDDSGPNVIAAENLGMRGVLVTPGADLAALLRQHDIQ